VVGEAASPVTDTSLDCWSTSPSGRASFRDEPRLAAGKVRGHHLDPVMASHRPGGEPGPVSARR
jgi:hypothetical protein